MLNWFIFSTQQLFICGAYHFQPWSWCLIRVIVVNTSFQICISFLEATKGGSQTEGFQWGRYLYSSLSSVAGGNPVAPAFIFPPILYSRPTNSRLSGYKDLQCRFWAVQSQLHVSKRMSRDAINRTTLVFLLLYRLTLGIRILHGKRISISYEPVILLNALYLTMKCHSMYPAQKQLLVPHHQSCPLKTIIEDLQNNHSESGLLYGNIWSVIAKRIMNVSQASLETVRALSQVQRSRRAIGCTYCFSECLQSGTAPRKMSLIIWRDNDSSPR